MTQKEVVQRRIRQAYKSKKFGQVMELDLSGLELEELPPEIAQGNDFHFRAKLTKLNLSNNKITSIPEEFGQLMSGLISLTLDNNKITSIPEVVWQLRWLSYLNLGNNKITSIPEAIGQLQRLSSLNLDNNKITSIPEAIGQLQWLSDLNLRKNEITSIPEVINKLSYLRAVDLSNNKITSIPKTIKRLSKLIELNLSHNQITQIPDVLISESIGQPSNLRCLDIHDNKITSIPEAIGQLSKLTELDLGGNEITSIPEAIGQLSNLTRFDIRDNKITSIPEAIGQLSKLTELDLSNNEITSISEELGQLSELKMLNLGCTGITFIPETIWQLSNLRQLNLSFNQISSIPETIKQLSNLRELLLSSNQITKIPETIRSMENLEILDLRNNPVPIPPQVLGHGQDYGGCGDLRTILAYYFHIPNPALPELDTKHQKIESEGNLEKVDLQGNLLPISPETLGDSSKAEEVPEEWLTIMKSFFPNLNPALPELDTKHQKIESEGNLEKVDLQGNLLPISPETLGDSSKAEEVPEEGLTIMKSFFQTSNPPLPELDSEYQKIEFEGDFDPKTLHDARRRITASIVQRQGQPEFRRKLLIAYRGRCPITDCDVEAAIEAAHIIPYQGTQTNHLTNGLPLRADIHTLFDLHLLSIQPDTNEVVIAPELVGTCYQDLTARKLTLPQDKKAAPNQSALSKHYETFLNKCKSSQLPAR